MPQPTLSTRDVQLFAHYNRSISWNHVPSDDRASFRDLRERLKALATEGVRRFPGVTPMRAFASHPSPSGRTAKHYWCCIYPARVPNKSFGLQVALIVTQWGVELCFCLGAGSSGDQDPEAKERNDESLARTKRALGAVSVQLVQQIEEELSGLWSYQRTWLTPGDVSHFANLTDWIHYAVSPQGSAASVSRFFSPGDLDGNGGALAVEAFFDAARIFAPLLDAVYTPKESPTSASYVADPVVRSAGRVAEQRRPYPAAEAEASPAEAEIREVLSTRDQMPAFWPEQTSSNSPRFTIEDALKGLFLERTKFEEMLSVLHRKKNLILAGPPGVGKTFVARRLAYALIEAQDPSRVEMVQFHQSYAYEDFIQGWRPGEDGFDRKDGIFHQFCMAAARDGRPYVFIIDEINRGNLSKVFGEVMMLIEPDKRGEAFGIPLTYSKGREERFYIPSNLYMIGMMNTADRSLAMVDYALRRRFGFVTVEPAFGQPPFQAHLASCGVSSEIIDRIVRGMTHVNSEIFNDKDLGSGFQVGHSYFVPCDEEGTPGEEWLQRILRTEIEPLLEEYWFENPKRVRQALTRFHSSRTSAASG